MAGPPGFEPGTSGFGGWHLKGNVPLANERMGRLGIVLIPIIYLVYGTVQAGFKHLVGEGISVHGRMGD